LVSVKDSSRVNWQKANVKVSSRIKSSNSSLQLETILEEKSILLGSNQTCLSIINFASRIESTWN